MNNSVTKKATKMASIATACVLALSTQQAFACTLDTVTQVMSASNSSGAQLYMPAIRGIDTYGREVVYTLSFDYRFDTPLNAAISLEVGSRIFQTATYAFATGAPLIISVKGNCSAGPQDYGQMLAVSLKRD